MGRYSDNQSQENWSVFIPLTKQQSLLEDTSIVMLTGAAIIRICQRPFGHLTGNSPFRFYYASEGRDQGDDLAMLMSVVTLLSLVFY